MKTHEDDSWTHCNCDECSVKAPKHDSIKKEEIPTPRTDEVWSRSFGQYDIDAEMVKYHAETLERELFLAEQALEKWRINSDRLASCLSIWYNASGSRCMTSDADALAEHEILKSQRQRTAS